MSEETVGQRLRRLRRTQGLSQRALSTEHVSYAYISRIEAGRRRPSVKALREIAPKLGVSVHYLETGEEDPLWTAWRVIDGLLRERDSMRSEARSLRLWARELERRVSSREGRIDLDLIDAVREAAIERIKATSNDEGGNHDGARAGTSAESG